MERRSGAVAQHIRRVQPFGTLLTLELDRFSFIQALVAVFLDRREMYKNVFAGRTLNEAISFGPVEPLHHSMLSHSNSFVTTLVDPKFLLKTRRAAGTPK